MNEKHHICDICRQDKKVNQITEEDSNEIIICGHLYKSYETETDNVLVLCYQCKNMMLAAEHGSNCNKCTYYTCCYKMIEDLDDNELTLCTYCYIEYTKVLQSFYNKLNYY